MRLHSYGGFSIFIFGITEPKIAIVIIINIYSGWPRKSQRPIVSGLFPLGAIVNQAARMHIAIATKLAKFSDCHHTTHHLEKNLDNLFKIVCKNVYIYI